MVLVVTGISHRTAPVEFREKFAFEEGKLPEAFAALKSSGAVEEVVIVSTCNRVEIYAVSPLETPRAFELLRQFLCRNANHDEGGAQDEIYQLAEPHSLEHLFKVASGLDSMVLGETEILGQLKKAYDTALQKNHTGPRLNKAFQRAFNVAKHIRTHTNIQRGSVSVASVGVELAGKIFSSLAEHQVMVIGAGETSEKAARALLSRGAKSVIVSNRSFDRAEALARELGGRAVRFDDWSAEFAHVDIVVSSTAAPHYILDQRKLEPLMKLRHNRPLLLIDIAVPRDIDPEVNFMDNVYLYNIDDLQAIADDSLRQRQEEVARCEEIIRAKARELLEKPVRPDITPGTRLATEHE